jgi:hypothetical protein
MILDHGIVEVLRNELNANTFPFLIQAKGSGLFIRIVTVEGYISQAELLNLTVNV